MDQIEQLYEQAVKTKNRIVQANLRLVVSIAKRHVGTCDDFFSLVSDGNISLMRAVDKFDYARGNKFSTYATWAVIRNFARTIPDEFKHRERFRTCQDEMFDRSRTNGPRRWRWKARSTCGNSRLSVSYHALMNASSGSSSADSA